MFDGGKSFHIEHKVHVLSIRSNVRSTGRTMNKQLVLVSFPLKMLRKRSMRVTSIGHSQSLIGRYLLCLHHDFHAKKWTCLNYSSARKAHVQSGTMCFPRQFRFPYKYLCMFWHRATRHLINCDTILLPQSVSVWTGFSVNVYM